MMRGVFLEAVGLGNRVLGAGGGLAQQRIGEAAGVAQPEALGLFHALIDGGGRPDAVEEPELVDADGEDLLQERMNLRERPAGELLDQVLKLEQVLNHASLDLLSEGAVARVVRVR